MVILILELLLLLKTMEAKTALALVLLNQSHAEWRFVHLEVHYWAVAASFIFISSFFGFLVQIFAMFSDCTEVPLHNPLFIIIFTNNIIFITRIEVLALRLPMMVSSIVVIVLIVGLIVLIVLMMIIRRLVMQLSGPFFLILKRTFIINLRWLVTSRVDSLGSPTTFLLRRLLFLLVLSRVFVRGCSLAHVSLFIPLFLVTLRI